MVANYGTYTVKCPCCERDQELSGARVFFQSCPSCGLVFAGFTFLSAYDPATGEGKLIADQEGDAVLKRLGLI